MNDSFSAPDGWLTYKERVKSVNGDGDSEEEIGASVGVPGILEGGPS